MKTKTCLILTLLVSFSFSALAQDFQSGYFLGGYNMAFRMNPAIQNERNIGAVALGNIGAGVNSNQLGINSFLFERHRDPSGPDFP